MKVALTKIALEAGPNGFSPERRRSKDMLTLVPEVDDTFGGLTIAMAPADFIIFRPNILAPPLYFSENWANRGDGSVTTRSNSLSSLEK